jgi:transcriptional regulator with XRE-family HTH domain
VDTSNLQLGTAVRDRRRELSLTQQEIAALAGIASSSWSEMERGAWVPQRDGTRIGIARSLGWEPVALNEFIGDRDNDQPITPGAAFRWRRENLGLTIDDLARHVNRSSATIRSLENGSKVSNRSHRAIAWGLGWPEDAYERLGNGESPEELEVEAQGGNSEETLAALRSLLRGAGLTQMQVQVVQKIASDFMDDPKK